MKNKTQSLFKLLTKNSLRILQKSKLLIFQLGILLSIGIIIVVTIFSSTFLLSQSKNKVIKSGNLADLTITIPTEKLKESITEDSEATSATIYNGYTPADINLQEYLKSQNLEFVFSKNLAMSDITSGNSFLLSLANTSSIINSSVVNELVTDDVLPSPTYEAADEQLISNAKYFWLIREIISTDKVTAIEEAAEYFSYNNYMANKPWLLVRMVCNSVWNLPETTIQKIMPILEKIAVAPTSEANYNTYFNPFIGTPTLGNIRYNTNSYFYQLTQLFSINKVSYTGHGYSITATQIIPLIGIGGDIPFQIEYVDKSSFFSIISSNYMMSNRKTQAVLDPRTVVDAMALPYKTNTSNDNSVNPIQEYKVYNQDTGILEPQTDFLSWLNNLDEKYKVSINSLTYLIAGVGDAPNLLYPVQSATQLLVDSESNGVAYINNLGFNRAMVGTSYKPTVYYSVRYPPSSSLIKQSQILSELKQWTRDNYNETTAYLLSDNKQPNYLFYIWANFLNNLQYIITTIGAIIGGIVVFLGLIFISLLIRSITKINKVTFGVGLANGVSKTKLSLSFFPFALIPAVLFGTIAFFSSYFLINPTLDVVRDYWTLSINDPKMYLWLYFVIVAATFILLYVLIIAIIFITLRHNTQTILNSSSTFKVNPLIVWTKGFTNKLSSLWSFRTTFMMSNISRFVILLFSVVYVISLSAVIVGTNNLFKTSLASIERNKKYFVSYDLYSPTINSGYYSQIEYDMLGTSQQGMFNSYSSSGDNNYNSPANTSGEFYTGHNYNNALAYPYASDLYFTSLFMTNSNLANEINYNLQFMNNRLFSKILLDVEVNALGAMLNPWEFAKQIMPESVQYLAEQNTESLVQTNFDFYLWLQKQNEIALANDSDNYINIPGLEDTEYSQFNNKPITYKTYLPNVNGQPFTLNNSNISEDYLTASNKEQWIFIRELDSTTNTYHWVINQEYTINGAPSYTIKPAAAQLIVQFMTNNNNPLYKFWFMYCYDKNPNKGQSNQILPNYNYKLSSSAVPVNEGDETYTYLESTINRSKSVDVKIYGIKANSNLIYLYDSHGRDLKTKLSQYATRTMEVEKEDKTLETYKVYPLVINNVVARKYGLSTGQVISVSTSNTFDRFNLININENSQHTCMFEIVGITDTNYGNELYTLQTYANEILGFANPETNPNSPTTGWTSYIQPDKNYIPFNGVFTKDENLHMVKNYAGFYSPSGLSTILGDWGDKATNTNSGAMRYLFDANSDNLDKMTNLNLFVDRENNNAIVSKTLTQDQKLSYTVSTDGQNAVTAINKIINLFGSSSAIVAQMQVVDSPYITSQMGNTFDQVLTKVGVITIVAMLPMLTIIITLLAVIIIFESSRLISLLKILGYGDVKNLFSFMFVYVAVLVLGTILSIPISFAIANLIKAISFASFSIIATPILPWWIFIAGFGAVGVIFLMLFGFVYFKLKNINLSQEISVK